MMSDKTPMSSKPKSQVDEINRSKTAKMANTNGIPDSKGSDDTVILDDLYYNQPNQVDLLWTDINSDYLHGDLVQLFQVDYLSVVEAEGEAE